MQFFYEFVLLILTTLFIALTIGCGGTYHVDVEPVKVEVTHTFSLAEIRQAFNSVCKKELVDYTEEQLAECEDTKVAELLEALAN